MRTNLVLRNDLIVYLDVFKIESQLEKSYNELTSILCDKFLTFFLISSTNDYFLIIFNIVKLMNNLSYLVVLI